MYITKQITILILSIILFTSVERIDADKYDEEGNIDLNHTRRLLSIDGDKYDEEGNIDLNHTRRLLSIDGDKYDEEGNIDLNHTRRLLSIDGDKYDEEGNIDLNHTRRVLSIDEDKYDEEGNIDLNHKRRLLSIDGDKYDEEGNIDLNHTRRLLSIDGDKYDEEGNIDLNHTRRLLSIDGDKYDEEGNIDLNHTRRLLSIDGDKYDEEGNIDLNHTRRLLSIDGDKYDEEGNIDLNHTRRLLSIDGDKYDEEGNIDLNHTRRLLSIDGDKYDEEGNIDLNHTRRLLSIDGDKYDEEGNIDLNHTRRLLSIDGDKYDEETNIDLKHKRRLLSIDGDKYDEEGNIDLNHKRRLLSIDGDKYDEESNIDLNHRQRLLIKSSVIKSRQKRTAENYTGENVTDTEETTKDNMTEDCVGQKEFCNLSREDYVSMLNDYIYPHTYEWILIGTHTLVFITGLVGNALVCVAVYRNHSMRTVTNYFIVNLAAADFMVILFCLPATVLWDVTETWFLGDVLCKMLLYFQSVSVTVSVLTLTFISVDRWYAICFPLKFKSTTGRAKTAILIIWALALIFNAPELVVLTTEKSVPLRFELEYLVQCVATWSSNSDLVWHIIKVIFIYTLPLLLMTVAYYQIVKVLWRSEKIPGQAETIKLAPAEQTQLRSRRKAAKMLVAVVIMFAVCYFPVHLLSVLRYTLDMEQNDVITCLALISHVMCYANSAINPLIYNFMSGKFRREFRRAFCCSTASDLENFTTLSRITTSKKRPCDLMTFETKAQGRNVCSTTFVHNGYKNKYILT